MSCCAVWDDLALIKPITDPVSGCARRNQMAEPSTQDLTDTFQVKISVANVSPAEGDVSEALSL